MESPDLVQEQQSSMTHVALHRAANPWRPAAARDTHQVESEEAVYKNVKAILNKLTLQKFDTLVQQMMDLEVSTEELLSGTVDMIFETAISQQQFAVVYAKVCHTMINTKVPQTDNPEQFVSFRKLLLNRCQKEFEKDKTEEQDQARRQKEIDESKEEDKRRLKEEKEIAETKARRKSIGNMRFIGELFKLKMLTEAIMYDCLFKLLRTHEEESLKCMFKLLTTIGKELDHPKARTRMDQYFHQMDNLVRGKNVSSRIRFMLQDVAELRLANWMPQSEDNMEMMLKNVILESKSKKTGGRNQMMQGSKKGCSVSMGKKPARSRITKTSLDEVQLGHDGRPNFSSWGRGKSGGSRFGGSGGGGSEGRSSRMHMNQQDLALHRAANPWRPFAARDSHQVEPEELVYRKVKAILNKLTPQKFDTLVKQMMDLEVSTEELLVGTVDIIFETAICQLKFAVVYANMCHIMINNKVPITETPEQSVSFCKLLLNRCQKEFEKDKAEELDQAQWQKEIDEAKEEDKRRLKEEKVLAETKARHRSIGNIRFIGELFKLKMLTEVIMHDYLFKLLGTHTEESLECMSKLLTTIGKELDHPKARSNWVPRREDNAPKMIDQIHQEAQQEKHNKEMMLKTFKLKKKGGRNQMIQGGKDGWSVSMVKNRQLLDPAHSRIPKTSLDEVQLGHCGRPSFARWGRGRSGGSGLGGCGGGGSGGRSSRTQFSALSRPDGADQECPITPSNRLILSGQSTTTGSGKVRNDSSPNCATNRGDAKELSSDDLQRKTKALLDVQINDLKGMEATVGGEASRPPANAGLPVDRILDKLDGFLGRNDPNDLIVDWLEGNVGKERMADPQFIRALMTAVCSSSISGHDTAKKVDADVLKGRVLLLQKYLDHNATLELQALYALQALVYRLQQPSGVLRTFFDVLYDEDIISEDAFYTWDSSTDPAEQAGKGVAKNSVVQFFTWLRETEVEDKTYDDTTPSSK